jgi:nitrite reductase/ring-hydroxylating ferredoxin subunit
MSTKSIAVLDASELKDGQMKEVAFEDGKVLLSKLGSDIHATSAFCTHYGVGFILPLSSGEYKNLTVWQAPLAKGVLTNDGRVVW